MEHSFKEVIISSDLSNTAWNCCVWDPYAGTTITSFKEGNSSARGLSLIDREYIVSALKDKPILKVWTMSKTDRIENKIVVPGVVTALAVSPRGHHCVAAINNKLYTWEVSTGELVSIIDYHHQEVKCIKFTDDGWYFISGGKDSIVLVWRLNDVLSQHIGIVAKVVKPVYSWGDHSSDVTDLHIGHGGLKSRVATVSLDQTCRVYSLLTGKLIFSIFSDAAFYSVIMDPAEYFLFLGTKDGVIFCVKWYCCLQEKSLSLSKRESDDVFNGHSDAVTCLSTTMDGVYLLSGSNDATVKVWNVLSKVCMFTLNHFGPVTNAFFTMAPSYLISAEKMSPSMIIKPFKRAVVPNRFDESMEVEPIEMKLRSCQLSTCKLEACDDTFNAIANKGLSLIGAECKAELQRNLTEVKDTNRQLYSFSMNSFLYAVKDFKVFEN